MQALDLHTDDTTPHPSARLDNHLVQFYEDDEFPLDEVTTFLRRSLQADGVALVIARTEKIQRLRRSLHSSVLARSLVNLVALDARETLGKFMVDGRPDAALFKASVGQQVEAACAGRRQVHAFGEMVALLCEDGAHAAALELEMMWNALAREHHFVLMCAYPWRAFGTAETAQVFRHICGQHTSVGLARTDEERELEADDSGDRLVAELRQRALSLEYEVQRRLDAEAALRVRERELTDFVENAAEGLHKVDRDGVIVWANKAELALLGYEAHEYVGRHIAEFHVDKAVIDAILMRLRSGEALYDHPARLRCKDGSIKHVCIHSNAYFENGALKYTRCFTRDATAQHERERLLVELEGASSAKDEFLAMLGHELRNPLAPIVTALKLMRMRGETKTVHEQGIIERQVDHLVRLVDDLLDVSRITRGKVELRSCEVGLTEVLTRAVEMASLLLEQRQHQLSVDIEPDLHWTGDPARLAQVVSNLLTNAARYTSVGGQIHLRACRIAPDRLGISVRDNGVGIAPAQIPCVFELFYQGKQTVDRPEGGLGIGLALVKNLVELHGGTVAAHSEGLGLGSEFVVELPLLPEAANDAQSGQRPVPGLVVAVGTSTTAHTQPKRVVVVDDNADNADLLGELLEAEGFQVAVFHDPAQALASIPAQRPDVAILDIGLPVMDGYELANRIRQLPEGRACRLIALSGYGQREDKARSKAGGFSYHLVKPAEPNEVLATVHRLVQPAP
jgi:PAS domain S-box-containing protein